VDVTQVQQRMLDAYGIRVEPEMGRYVIRRLQQHAGPTRGEVPVIGGDARTGVPVRRLIDVAQFAPQSPASI